MLSLTNDKMRQIHPTSRYLNITEIATTTKSQENSMARNK